LRQLEGLNLLQQINVYTLEGRRFRYLVQPYRVIKSCIKFNDSFETRRSSLISSAFFSLTVFET